MPSDFSLHINLLYFLCRVQWFHTFTVTPVSLVRDCLSGLVDTISVWGQLSVVRLWSINFLLLNEVVLLLFYLYILPWQHHPYFLLNIYKSFSFLFSDLSNLKRKY